MRLRWWLVWRRLRRVRSMAVAGTVVEAGGSMVEDFRAMLDSLRRVVSRMRAVRQGSRVRVVMVAGIELLLVMAVGV